MQTLNLTLSECCSDRWSITAKYDQSRYVRNLVLGVEKNPRLASALLCIFLTWHESVFVGWWVFVGISEGSTVCVELLPLLGGFVKDLELGLQYVAGDVADFTEDHLEVTDSAILKPFALL